MIARTVRPLNEGGFAIMGTWGSGLYDNDSALDHLANLLEIEDEVKDPVELAARIGLLVWHNPTSLSHGSDHLEERIKACLQEQERLPEETRKALDALLEDPETATKGCSRKPEAEAVIGGYCDGPQIDALLRFPGARTIIEAFAEEIAQNLDESLAPTEGNDLYQASGSLAELGLLIDLALAGLFQPAPARVEQWRAGFTAIDKATKSERGFWWKYVRRVQAGFDLLAPRPPGAVPAPTAARRPARSAPKTPPAPAAPAERYQHPKLGVGVLVGRSGSGEEERLDLRFEDGQIRKILARFVTRVET